MLFRNYMCTGRSLYFISLVFCFRTRKKENYNCTQWFQRLSVMYRVAKLKCMKHALGISVKIYDNVINYCGFLGQYFPYHSGFLYCHSAYDCYRAHAIITMNMGRWMRKLRKQHDTSRVHNSWDVLYMGLLPHVHKFRVAHAPGMPGTFSPPPRVSDPDMHHSTCVTHVLWWRRDR